MESSLEIALRDCKIKWYLPQDDIAQEILNPAIAAAERFDCMSGYFSASVLKELAHGLARYLINSIEPLRLLVSADISIEDQKTIALGAHLTELAISLVEGAFQDESSLANALIAHTKSCLAYLVWQDRLQIKVVLMKEGIFHPKQWFFYAEGQVAILSGSANATGAGLSRNVEQLTLQRSWKSKEEEKTCEGDIEFFYGYWNGEMKDSITVDLPLAIAKDLLASYRTSTPPSLSAYQRALDLENESLLQLHSPVGAFEIPVGLDWETGSFSHQGDAVKAWETAGRKGILAMATGAGKTITSLIAAQRLHKQLDGLLIVIAVPTRPLLTQWAEDVRRFGISPYVGDHGTSVDHLRVIDEKLHAIELGFSRVEIVVITLNLLKDSRIIELLSRNSKRVLLIADEMHNLGVVKFTSNPPNVDFRLGLSATPERQYDVEGSIELFNYFGQVVFDFPLEKAIGICLVPYDYFIAQIQLTSEEQEKYAELSEKIRKQYAMSDKSDNESKTRIQRLLEQRRSVLESAAGKVDALRKLLVDKGPDSIKHTLIYCTDKNPDQLVQVNQMLQDLNIRYHQITDEESGNQKLVASTLGEFRKGNLQVLTAKRILDEGFNIPEIARAYVLASTTVQRQWTQRRGRVLRLCKAIQKVSAEIIDFVAIPPSSVGIDVDAKKIVEAELGRVEEFARLARNRASKNGPFDQVQVLKSEYLVWGSKGS